MKILLKTLLLGLIGSMFTGCIIIMPPSKETVMAQQLDVWCIRREVKDKELYEEAVHKAQSFSDKSKYGDKIQITPRGEYSISMLDKTFIGSKQPGLYWREYGMIIHPAKCDRENKKINIVVELTPDKIKAQNEKDKVDGDANSFIKSFKDEMAKSLYSSKEIGELMELGSSLDLIFKNYETRKEIDRETYDFAGYQVYAEELKKKNK